MRIYVCVCAKGGVCALVCGVGVTVVSKWMGGGGGGKTSNVNDAWHSAEHRGGKNRHVLAAVSFVRNRSKVVALVFPLFSAENNKVWVQLAAETQ